MINVSVKNKLLVEVESCPFCGAKGESNLGEHIKAAHGEDKFRSAVLAAKEAGIADPKIGEIFNISFKQLERIITEVYGINISALKKPKKIKSWTPKDYQEETTTVWSFRRRGNWASHDGRYRGNWSPFIPRNVIIKYSKLGDIVLDYFVGGGTTAVEAKLLGRKCIARDINPAAIGLTRENLRFDPPAELFGDYPTYEADLAVGDARKLEGIQDESIDLICSHPPYAGIISYGSKIEGDLSGLNYDDFIQEMRQIAEESYRVLKVGGKCAILIGDSRKKKHIVPIGFGTINVFLAAKFRLKELVIKRQHNCKTTGFWYSSSIRHNFLLLAHEYLAIFEKPKSTTDSESKANPSNLVVSRAMRHVPERAQELETTSVWIFPAEDFERQLDRNIIQRYSESNDCWQISFNLGEETGNLEDLSAETALLYIKSPCLNGSQGSETLRSYVEGVERFVKGNIHQVRAGGFVVIRTSDVRLDGHIEPLAKRFVDKLQSDDLWLKEIIIVTSDEPDAKRAQVGDDLHITHQYLLVYEVLDTKPRG